MTRKVYNDTSLRIKYDSKDCVQICVSINIIVALNAVFFKFYLFAVIAP